MEVVTVLVPSEYGAVLLTVASIILVRFWHMVYAVTFQMDAQIPPHLRYAPHDYITPNDDEQVRARKGRLAYQNDRMQHEAECVSEAYASVISMVLISGLKYPYASIICGVSWCVGKMFRTVVYGKQTQPKRLTKLLLFNFAVSLLYAVLVVLTIMVGASLLLS